MLTTAHCSFRNSVSLKLRLSDIHKMTVTTLKTYFKELGPKIINYQDDKNFSYRNLFNYRQIAFDEFQNVQGSHESWSLEKEHLIFALPERKDTLEHMTAHLLTN